MSAGAVELIQAVKALETQAVELVDAGVRFQKHQAEALKRARKRLARTLAVLESRS